ncbi:MAG: Unknown protein [uncultured Sulfurovum sp.]|uniref:Uncharacterized protein n=1 Tax=uncultured Sulfurovum sp. TaxID=269237 RepID=A0A6S6TWZ8_9BACT|nr:MAG: Unknown protein [uncultured Sulfurovum sp.]
MIEKFKRALKKEIIFYLVILVLLALVAHSDLLSNPSLRFEMMFEKGNYLHPFFYAFVLYSVLLLIRKTLEFIIGLFEK